MLTANAECAQWNDGEAMAVMEHVRRLMAAGIQARDIGVITPYNAQVGRGACSVCIVPFP